MLSSDPCCHSTEQLQYYLGMPSTITSTDGWVYVEYNDLYYYKKSAVNQLYIAAMKWFLTHEGACGQW